MVICNENNQHFRGKVIILKIFFISNAIFTVINAQHLFQQPFRVVFNCLFILISIVSGGVRLYHKECTSSDNIKLHIWVFVALRKKKHKKNKTTLFLDHDQKWVMIANWARWCPRPTGTTKAWRLLYINWFWLVTNFPNWPALLDNLVKGPNKFLRWTHLWASHDLQYRLWPLLQNPQQHSWSFFNWNQTEIFRIITLMQTSRLQYHNERGFLSAVVLDERLMKDRGSS